MESRSVEILTGIADDKFSGKNVSGHFTVKELIDLTFHPQREVGFRAAWLLEYIFTTYGCIGSHVEDFLTLFARQNNPSCMRHYGKIAAYITGKKVEGLQPGQLEKIDFEPLIDTLFSWLIDEKVLVATKVHCMQTLANLAPKYTWIKEELLDTIAYLEDRETVAFFGRAKQVKKALARIKE